MKPRTMLAVGVFSFAAALTPPATAQTTGPEVRVRASAYAGNTFNEVAASEGNETFVAWIDTREGGPADPDVYVQKLSAVGAPVWGVDGLAIATGGAEQIVRSITPDGAGGAVVAWREEEGNSRLMRAQRVSAAGDIMWAPGGVQVSENILLQAALWVNQHPTGPWTHPTSEGTLVSWWDAPPGQTESDNFVLRAQKLDADGQRMWGNDGIEVMTGINRAKTVSDGAGGLVAVGRIKSQGGFRFQRVLADQSVAWTAPVDVVLSIPVNDAFDFAADGVGGGIVSYVDSSGGFGNTAIRAIRVTNAGALPWDAAAAAVATSSVNTNNGPLITGDGQGGAFVAWVSDSPRRSRLQHIGSDGTHLWGTDGVPAGSFTQSTSARAISADGAGGMYLAYQNTPYLRVQRFDSTGEGKWFTQSNFGFQFANGSNPSVNAIRDGAIFVFHFDSGISAHKIFAETTALASRLANISTRAFVGAGDQQAIPGFAIRGTGDKEVLIRAIGPTLGGFGVPGTIADPMLTLSDSASAVIATRDNWGEAGDAAEVANTSDTVGAFPLDSGSLDAALVISLASGTTYTAGITGAANGTGAGLVEIYDTGEIGSSSFLSNLSSRVFVGTGEQQAIAGIVIEGNAPLTLLIRAVGPTLGGFGVSGTLADPTLTLFNGDGVAIATNDNWEEDGMDAADAIKAAADTVGAFELGAGSLDAAVVATLSPGSYTAGVTGVGGLSGIVLLEIYIVPAEG